MTTLREAAQMALDALDSDNPDIQLRAATNLRAALAQPEQEVESDRNHVEDDGCPTEKAVLQRFWREHQMQELEGINDVILNSIRDSSEIVAPPQREWQGLTDEEIEKLFVWQEWSEDFADYEPVARAIEAKLREKNT